MPLASLATATRVTTVEGLVAALEDSSVHGIQLALAGSPYRLGKTVLRLTRDVVVEGETEGASVVLVIGAFVISAGTLRSLEVRPGVSCRSGGTPRLPSATIVLDGVRDGELTPTTLQAVRVHAAVVTRPPSASAPSASNGSALPPPLALRIGAGASRVDGCCVHGGVLVCERSSAVLISCEVVGAVGAGVELRGTAAGCSVRKCTVRECGGAGLLVAAGAGATLSDNRVDRCAGTGIEAHGRGGKVLVERNVVSDVGGVGLLVRDGRTLDATENTVRGMAAAAARMGVVS
jgi:hypothetical protein